MALTENERYIGGLILRHLQALQFNSHEVAELVIMDGNKKSVFIGGAVYPTLALFNHSCNPGIVRYAETEEILAISNKNQNLLIIKHKLPSIEILSTL